MDLLASAATEQRPQQVFRREAGRDGAYQFVDSPQQSSYSNHAIDSHLASGSSNVDRQKFERMWSNESSGAYLFPSSSYGSSSGQGQTPYRQLMGRLQEGQQQDYARKQQAWQAQASAALSPSTAAVLRGGGGGGGGGNTQTEWLQFHQQNAGSALRSGGNLGSSLLSSNASAGAATKPDCGCGH
ncbi:Hypothetical protein UVM_LOCUS232 [uncultured virus]|nr:Hypothetical protein UVM_LOCUS232 [uncultured virus]